MYRQSYWELVADSLGFEKHTLGTAGIVNRFWNNLDIGPIFQ